MPARKPTALKALTGTLREDRRNKREPAVPVASPRPLRALAADVEREHENLLRLLEPMRVLSAGDVLAVELCASALAEFWRLRGAIDAKGETYETLTPAGSTMIRVRPEIALAADAWRRAAAMLQRLGLDPVSRARVETIQELDPSSKFAGMLGPGGGATAGTINKPSCHESRGGDRPLPTTRRTRK